MCVCEGAGYQAGLNVCVCRCVSLCVSVCLCVCGAEERYCCRHSQEEREELLKAILASVLKAKWWLLCTQVYIHTDTHSHTLIHTLPIRCLNSIMTGARRALDLSLLFSLSRHTHHTHTPTPYTHTNHAHRHT